MPQRDATHPGDPAITTRRAAASNDEAMDAFIAAKAEIHLLPERLKALSDELFKTHPEEIY